MIYITQLEIVQKKLDNVNVEKHSNHQIVILAVMDILDTPIADHVNVTKMEPYIINASQMVKIAPARVIIRVNIVIGVLMSITNFRNVYVSSFSLHFIKGIKLH